MHTTTDTASQRTPTGGPYFPAGSSAIVITRIASRALLDEMIEAVRSHFTLPTPDYVKMDAESYRAIVAKAQNRMNERQLTRSLTRDRIELLMEVLATKDILIQRNLHLRATRPQINSSQENIGWHRESFYGSGVERCVNVWTPIANVSAENSLRYIPDSHLIPDDQLGTVSVQDPITRRHSTGHMIGLPYAPKNIVSGVDLSHDRAFDVALGEAAVFSGALIHGSAKNNSSDIRFSADFRVIAREAYQGDINAGDGNNFFVPI
jgi:ectoine hydroxylase-related dioxygenase (phytanoyl-CoA dioxygenase family)